MHRTLFPLVALVLGPVAVAQSQSPEPIDAFSAAHAVEVLERSADGGMRVAVTARPGSREPLLVARPADRDVVLESVLLHGPLGARAAVSVDGSEPVRASAAAFGTARFDFDLPLVFDERGRAGHVFASGNHAGPQVSSDPYSQLPGFTGIFRIDPPDPGPFDLRAFTGFESGDLAEFTTVNGSGLTVQNAFARSGEFALQAQANPGDYAYVTIQDVDDDGFPSSSLNIKDLYLSFQFGVSSWSERVRIAEVGGNGGEYKVHIELEPDGRISIEDHGNVRRFGQTVLSTNQWYRIEVLVGTGFVSTLQLHVDGQLEIDASQVNVSQELTRRVHIGRSTTTGGASVCLYDDVVVSAQDYPGDARVLMMKPNGLGSSATWLGDHLDVDDWPHDGDLTYAVSNGPGAFLTTLQPPTLPTVQVLGVRALAVQRRESSNYSASTLRLRSGGLDFDTPAGDGGTNWRLRSMVFPQDPATGTWWTQAALGSLEVGIDQLDPDVTDATRASALGATVLVVQNSGAAPSKLP